MAEIWEMREPWLEVREYEDCVTGRRGWCIHLCKDGGLLPNGSRLESSTYCLEGRFGLFPETFVGIHPTRESALSVIEDSIFNGMLTERYIQPYRGKPSGD